MSTATPPEALASTPSAAADRADDRARRLAVVIVVLLTAGSFLCLLGWVAGVVLAWTRTTWPRRARLVATLVVPGGPAGAVLLAQELAAASAFTCSGGVGGPAAGPGVAQGGPGAAGAGLGGPDVVPVVCSTPTVPGAVAAAAALALLVASVAGPAWAAAAGLRRRDRPAAP